MLAESVEDDSAQKMDSEAGDSAAWETPAEMAQRESAQPELEPEAVPAAAEGLTAPAQHVIQSDDGTFLHQRPNSFFCAI